MLLHQKDYRRTFDIVFVKSNARGKWTKRAPGQFKHLERRIDPVEMPFVDATRRGYPDAARDESQRWVAEHLILRMAFLSWTRPALSKKANTRLAYSANTVEPSAASKTVRLASSCATRP